MEKHTREESTQLKTALTILAWLVVVFLVFYAAFSPGARQSANW